MAITIYIFTRSSELIQVRIDHIIVEGRFQICEI